MSLDRRSVERTAGITIAGLQRHRHVSDAEKRAIRAEHEKIARETEAKARRK